MGRNGFEQGSQLSLQNTPCCQGYKVSHVYSSWVTPNPRAVLYLAWPVYAGCLH